MLKLTSLAPLRWALLTSLVLHVALLGWAGAFAHLEPEQDIDSLRVVQVDPEDVTLPPLREDEVVLPILPAPPREAREPVIDSRLVLPPPPVRAERNRRRAPRPDTAQKAAHPRRIGAASKGASPRRRQLPPSSAKRRGASVPRTGGGGNPLDAASRRGDLPTHSSPAVAGGSGDLGEELEDVPEGPVDLEAVGGVQDAVKLSPLTKGSMLAANPNVKGQLRAAFVRVKPFDGPGVFYTTTLNVPPSAPPGTVYQLEFSEVVLAGADTKPITFTPVSGTLTVVPTKSPLPPAKAPKLSGSTIGVGQVYAHRGTQVVVEVYAGDGLKGISGVQAKLKYTDVKVGKRRNAKKPPTASQTPSTKKTAPSAPSSPASDETANDQGSASG